MPIACMKGIEGITWTPVAAEIMPGEKACDSADPFLVAGRNREHDPAQPHGGIDDQQGAEKDGAVSGIVARQHARVQPGAGSRARHQRPEPADDVAQVRTDEGLPDVRDDCRHDHDGDRMRRRHRDCEQAHRNRRQPKADDTLDEAGQKESRDDEQQKRVDHVITLTDEGDRHNLQLVELAFACNEG
jgi:hypothetical protein